MTVLAVLIVLLVLAFMLFSASVKVVQEYERGVVFRLGRLMGPRGPGLILLVPMVERMRRVDLRIITLDVPSQECISKDNVTLKVNAVIYFKIVGVNESVVNVLNFQVATLQIAQTTLRNVIGQSLLDELLSDRERINLRLQTIIDEQTEPWGVKVTLVEVKDVELPAGMQRAMARQAEAERERRAKVINADGEFQASQRLAEAGRVLAEVPTTMQLRFLQTLSEVLSSPNNNTVIAFPLPLEIRGIMPQGPLLGEAVPAAPLPSPSGETSSSSDGNGSGPEPDTP
ncbi:MAG TPA: slipin family protein [Dehalococcoidia bacterium]|nr:slipin family protein [Dehalococcoidia bacterium]